jgi:lipoic acid synthetase
MDNALLPADFQRKPDWLKVKFPSGETWKKVDEVLARHGLHTVCDEAHCPNKGECWGMGTATFMILGDLCTRGCRFCAVNTAGMGRPVRAEEGREIALAAKELGLDYVVLTSVDRDDLPDRGAGHFVSCVASIREVDPLIKIEALIPDYHGAELEPLVEVRPDVIAHNVETVRSLQHIRDGRASFDKSLRTLREAKAGIRRRSGVPDGKAKTKSTYFSGWVKNRKRCFPRWTSFAGRERTYWFWANTCGPQKNRFPWPNTYRPNSSRSTPKKGGTVALDPSSLLRWQEPVITRKKRKKMVVEGMGRPAGCKLIRVSADIENGIIRFISIRGDFFASPEEAFERAESRLRGIPAAEAGTAFDSFLKEEGVEAFGINGAGLGELLAGALHAGKNSEGGDF